MKYVLAIILPPFAILVCGKPIQFIINLIFWIASIPLLFLFGIGGFVWLLCCIHALVVCAGRASDKRMDRLVQAIESRPPVSPAQPA